MRGMSRHLRLPALVASLLALPSLVLPSAAGNAPWSKVKLTAETHLGTVELTATTKGAREQRTLDQLTIVDAAGDDLDEQVLYPFPGDDRTDR
jgi:hypothetical protein